jgi:hypothetical protein
MSKFAPKRLASFGVVLWLVCFNARSTLQINVTDLNPAAATASTVNGTNSGTVTATVTNSAPTRFYRLKGQ